jgi:hypothetical protein
MVQEGGSLPGSWSWSTFFSVGAILCEDVVVIGIVVGEGVFVVVVVVVVVVGVMRGKVVVDWGGWRWDREGGAVGEDDKGVGLAIKSWIICFHFGSRSFSINQTRSCCPPRETK